ncbi:MAG: 5'-nucleotidase C-terminal domain-containing protein [Bacteroidota bacterium]
MIFLNRISFIIYILLAVSCGSTYQITRRDQRNIRIYADSLKLYDTAMANRIAPYKQKLDAQMNVVIGSTSERLVKSLPDGALGNMMADACLDYANKTSDKPVDFCVLNYGGIRLPSIEQGDITLGKIYELMPFDNMIVSVELNGQQCMDLFKWIASWKGSPVAGISMVLNDSSASNVLINGVPFDYNKTYWVATTDYVANGGDKATMFAGAKTIVSNHKLRDAIIEYIKVTRPMLKADNYGRIK